MQATIACFYLALIAAVPIPTRLPANLVELCHYEAHRHIHEALTKDGKDVVKGGAAIPKPAIKAPTTNWHGTRFGACQSKLIR